MKPTITICGQNVGVLMLQQVVHMEISVLERANRQALCPLSSTAVRQRTYPTYRSKPLSAEDVFLRGRVFSGPLRYMLSPTENVTCGVISYLWNDTRPRLVTDD
jgi:hypothetical protein